MYPSLNQHLHFEAISKAVETVWLIVPTVGLHLRASFTSQEESFRVATIFRRLGTSPTRPGWP